MKKKLVFILMLATIIAGCGEGSTKEASVSYDVTSDSTISNSEISEGTTKAQSSGESDIEVSSDNSAETPTAEVTALPDEQLPSVVELNEEEIAYFTDFIQARDNYGFLMSEYDDVSNVELENIFYNNAGWEMEHLNDAEMARYLDYLGEENISVGSYKIPMSYVNEVLSLRTGQTYEDMSKGFNPRYWYYDAQSDSFFHFCGDVNYEKYVVEYGFRTADNHVVLRVYQSDYEDSDTYGYLIPRKLVVLTEDAGDYLFESCNYIKDYNAICDYCYKVCEPNVGNVEIYAYSPIYPNHDYTLMLYCQGKAPITLNSKNNNILTNVTFDHIDSISIRDYNSDATADLAVVAVYKFNDKDEYINDVRIYDWYYGSFRYSDELTEEYKNRTPDWNGITADKALDFCASQVMHSGEWKSEAISQLAKINENVSYESGGYCFLYIDGDQLPEILAISGKDYVDEVVVTTDGTEVHSTLFPGSNFEVCSVKGLVKVSFDSAEIHKDTLYYYGNGVFSLQDEGSYIVSEGNIDQYDEILWDMQPVSIDEYKAFLDEAGYFVSYNPDELMDYDELVRTIEGTYEPIFE